MKKIFIDFLICSSAAFCLAILFHIPKRGLLPGAVLGGAGYVIYSILLQNTNELMISYFFASLFITICSEIFARLLKMPATIFTVPGIITIVPGLKFYNAMILLVDNNMEASTAILEAFLSVLGISMGMVLTSLLTKSINSLLTYFFKLFKVTPKT